MRPLRHVADPLAVAERARVFAEQSHRARLGPQPSEEKAQQRRLPAAVRADQRGELARVHAERDGFEHGRGAVRERDVVGLDDDLRSGFRHGHHTESDSQCSEAVSSTQLAVSR